MRNYILLTLLLAFIGFLSFAGRPEGGAEAFASPNVLPKTWTLDTITNAANDTLTLPWTLQSRYTGALQITRTNISGTTNLSVVIQSSVTSASSSDATWVAVATSAGTGATAEVLTLAETYGQRYRIIVDGTGTQSSSYQLSWLSKKMPN